MSMQRPHCRRMLLYVLTGPKQKADHTDLYTWPASNNSIKKELPARKIDTPTTTRPIICIPRPIICMPLGTTGSFPAAAGTLVATDIHRPPRVQANSSRAIHPTVPMKMGPGNSEMK